MDQTRWKLIKNAYAESAERAEPERIVYLAKMPDDIRIEVNKLLDADMQAGDFIEQPFLVEQGSVANSHGLDLGGQRIDEYQLLETIGSGGMGSVYLAEHEGEGFSQKVAIKLIKRGMDTSAVLKRFLMERQILANLEHPFIGRMLDGGSTKEGLPYFVMEYVDGVSIKTYCDSNRLGTKHRLLLFIKVCSAVTYAHQNLVVHRDLKPSNILINKDGDPKLLDFGIAKLLSPDWNTSSEAATATQFRILTPEYASPEQFRGEITTTVTDVYSLGVVLYELLTGARPYRFDGMNSAEIGEALQSQEPRKPSTAAAYPAIAATVAEFGNKTGEMDGSTSGVPRSRTDSRALIGDLDNIVLKAIRREPERRYASVQELADDIRRHLDGLPVTATADTFSYRVGKFVSRHRAAFSAASVVGFLLIFSTSFAIWQAFRANEQRAIAEKRFNDVRTLANSLMFDVHDSIKDLPGATPARKLLVDRALNYLDELAKEARHDMTLQSELASGYEKIGDVQGNPMGPNLGEADAAIESYNKALAIRELLASDPAKQDEQYAAAMLHSKLYRVMQVRNDLAAAEFHCREAIGRLEGLTAAQPANLLNRVTMARFHLELADLLVSKKGGDIDEAIENYRKSISIGSAIPITDEANEKAPDGLSLNEKILSVTQMAYRRLGQRFELQKNPAEALDAYLKALDASEKLLAAGNPRKPLAEFVRAISLGNAGRLQAAIGNTDDGLAKALEMLKICEKAVAEDPQNYLAAGELSNAHGTLGYVFFQRGDFPKALENYRRARQMQEGFREKNPDDVYNLGNLGETFESIGSVHEKTAHFREAREWYQQSLDLWLELKKEDKLPEYFAGKPDEQSQNIARCTAAL
jgi:serine/threonine protein kinase